MKTENCSRRSALKTMLAGTAASLLHAQESRRDSIRLDSEYQTIENFSASDCWSMQKLGTWSLPNRNRVADLLFSQTGGIGLSCWRFNVGGGITDKINDSWRTAETFEIAEGKYDWTRQAPERWFLGAAKARGVPQFLAFVNSPPGRMTRTGITYGQRGTDTTNLKPGFQGQFARYLVDILEHFRANPDKTERIAFNYISPVNEPNVEWNGLSQEGCRADNDDIKAVLRALDAELKKRKCPTQIAGIEVSGLPPLYSLAERMSKTYNAKYGNYVDEFLGDNSIAGLLNHRLSYHDYGSDLVKGQLIENRQRFPIRNLMSPNLQQLDFENQRGSARNRGRVAVVPVRDLGRAYQPGLPTYFHFLHAFGPAANHAAQRELRGLIALVRAVKLRSVDQCAPIVHLHRIGGLGRGAGSGLKVHVDQAGLCLERAWLRGRLCQIRLGGALLLLRHTSRAGLPERLKPGRPFVHIHRRLAGRSVGKGALD